MTKSGYEAKIKYRAVKCVYLVMMGHVQCDVGEHGIANYIIFKQREDKSLTSNLEASTKYSWAMNLLTFESILVKF